MSTHIKSVEQFNTLVKQYPKVVVDFKAVWCGPCRLISPAFDKLAIAQKTRVESNGANVPDDTIFLTVDVDEVGEIAQRFNITAMPTFKFLVNGQEHSDLEILGASKPKLEASVKALATKSVFAAKPVEEEKPVAAEEKPVAAAEEKPVAAANQAAAEEAAAAAPAAAEAA
ncbi:thioredoxin-like protein [Kickxella alabastrina]|uniref:thioredoxin-like protein n=1 Tax=Kickxella alabastrina TaxID=61397 RepID=UPI00221FD5B5|nr:thioredoxin-like protein [Kickxella alabastrina]KAI7833531.1 thioredoxin-like protein [Kickxella alabastrina]